MRSRSGLNSSDPAFSYFEYFVLARHEAKIHIGNRSAVDPHRALADEPARLAGGGSKLQLLHQFANPQILGDSIHLRARGNFAALMLALEVIPGANGGILAVIFVDNNLREPLFSFHRMKLA